MCRVSDVVTHPKVPSWITQTRDEVADAELEAASIHYTWMTMIEDRTLPDGYEQVGGDYAHHEYWWRKHQEAAWFASPSYTEQRLGR